MGLADKANRLPNQISGGEKERVAVARAIVNEPPILLADEPTGALDRGNVGTMAELLVELNREDGLTLLVVTHSESLASRMGRILEIEDGKLVERS